MSLPRRDAMVLAVVALVAAALLFTALGRADLYNPDEPREAEMAREMRAGGDLLVPRLNGEPFLEKPPLFYWLVITAYRVAGGPGEAAARAVPALAGLLCVLLTWFLARDLIGLRAAPLAAVVLATSFEFYWISRRCLIDMPLTFAVLLACVALYRGIVVGGGHRVAWLLTGYLAIGAAVLFKGIVGAGIPALAAIGWLAARRDWRGIWRHALVPGGLLALVPTALWVARLGSRLGGGAVHEFVVVNNIMRFTGGAAKGHDNPFYYYLPTLLVDLAPWSIALLFAIVAAVCAARRDGPPGDASPGDGPPGDEEARPRALVDLLLWFGLPVLILSLASTKRGLYLLPIHPPAAMLVAWWLSTTGGAARAWGRRLLLGLTVVLAAGILAALRLARPGDLLTPGALVALLIPPGVVAFRAMRSDAGRRFGYAIAAATAVLLQCITLVIVPEVVNGGTSAREAAGDLARMADAGDPIALYQFREGMIGGFLFYSARTFPNLRDPDRLKDHLEGGSADPFGPQPIVLMRAAAFTAAAAALPFPIREVRRYSTPTLLPSRAGEGDYILVARDR